MGAGGIRLDGGDGMSNTELAAWLMRQLREALSIVEEQAALLALHGVAEYEGDGCSPSLSQRREMALQGGAEALAEAEKGA